MPEIAKAESEQEMLQECSLRPEDSKTTSPAQNASLCPFAVISLALGLVGFPATCCCCLGIPGLLSGILGCVAGYLGLSLIKVSNGTLKGRGLCIAGLIISYLAIAANLLLVALYIYCIC